MSPAPNLGGLRIESLDVRRWSRPYPGTVTGGPTLRIIVSIAPRGMLPCEVRIEVDDASVSVASHGGTFELSGIEALFVVERQPPAWRFLTWYGVFARRHGRGDRLLLETPDGRSARFVERVIEERLG